MLGWCPHPSLQNRASAGRTCLSQSHEIVQFSPFLDEKPVLQPPHQTVIGFDLGVDVETSKSLNTQACDSPRSVLKSHHPQSASPRSPLSALGSLLADRGCRGSNVVKGAVSKHSRARASKNRIRGRESPYDVCREVHGICRFGTILSSDDEDECCDKEIDISMSIFSTASPVSRHSVFCDRTLDFLSKCFRCMRQLQDGKDIFMYRGDQAFCSQECRYKQIVADDRKHRSPVVTPCFSGVRNDHRSVVRPTQAAFA
ncbi:hypothetical protein GOP47_0029926 [Adiantum capillus-veneris]|nr:hypothetical protein GOP47_0029926 [Adiantum capillus-veneris]